MAKLISLALILFCLSHFAKSQPENFVFNGFLPDTLTLDGSSAAITPNGLLQLTNETRDVIGHAFYPSPINMVTVSSFSTSFVFGIIPSDRKRGGGHGFAFTLLPLNKLAGAYASHYLGLFNPSNNNGNLSNHVFAVEFDTVGTAGGFGDINGGHVGIDVNSLNSHTPRSASYYLPNGTQRKLEMESGDPIRVWIDYDGVRKTINVTLSPLSVPRSSRPLLSMELDLSSVLTDSMYVGFSASTGKLCSSHYILGWSFRKNGTAQEIEEALLPLLPPFEGPSSSVLPPVEGPSSPTSNTKHALAVVPVTAFLLALVALWYLYRLRKKRQAENLQEWELDCPHRFRYKDLCIATKGFNASEIVGVGGFGAVYKGVLPTTGEEIAVKRISHNSMQGVREFVAEIESLGRLRHKNLVHLLGWCKRAEVLLLVYDFIPNGSLEGYLLKRKDDFVLSWERRFNIVRGITSAILYLHQDWEQLVVHRDIKASNVLLDEDLNGRLGDFGLARLYDHGDDPRTTHLVGTLGYIAPELARTGKATASSDVYAYGTLLLILACGKRPIDPVLGHYTLLDWVSDRYLANQFMEVVDPKLNSSYVIEEMEMVLKLGLMCCRSNPGSRPSMKQVVRIIDGDDSLPADDVIAYDAYLNVANIQSVFSDADSKSVNTHSQISSTGVMSTNSLEIGR